MLQNVRSLYECWDVGKLDDNKFRQEIVRLQGEPLSGDCDKLLRKQGSVRGVAFKDFVQTLRRSRDTSPPLVNRAPTYTRCSGRSADWAPKLTSAKNNHERKHFFAPAARGVPEAVGSTAQPPTASKPRPGAVALTKSFVWDPPVISPRIARASSSLGSILPQDKTSEFAGRYSPRQREEGTRMLRESTDFARRRQLKGIGNPLPKGVPVRGKVRIFGSITQPGTVSQRRFTRTSRDR